ncbi:MAG: hypothetical protein ACRD5K_06735 [Candidatus Acidiferrales bacterium]
MISTRIPDIEAAIGRFVRWLDGYGETSFDHQSYYASKIGRAAKAMYYRRPIIGKFAVAPMVLSEAFLPSARKLYWKKQRFPIADAHYAMGFALLAKMNGAQKDYRHAVHFLTVLEETRCPDYPDYCWGYPFDWETRNGPMTGGTPLITTLPYAYEAFSYVYSIDSSPRWREVLRSIAEHGFRSYRDMETGTNAASCAYTPSADDPCGVVNASAYRAFLLTQAGIDFSDELYSKVATKNLNFVIQSQNSDGSWRYSIDGARNFVDHFHTCFVLKALAKIERLTGSTDCRRAIDRGVAYYAKNLFDATGLPVPFSRAPRLTIYRRELYDYAECINLGALLYGRYPVLDKILSGVITDLLSRWQKADGSFRARELLLGWDNVPMHRWAQGQTFRSLCFLLSETQGPTRGAGASGKAQITESTQAR